MATFYDDPSRGAPVDADASAKEIIEAGISAGLIGGLVMMLFAMIKSATSGLGFWLPLKLVAGAFYGPEVIIGGAGITLLGLTLHFFTAAAWGVVFSAVVSRRLRAVPAVLAGMLYGTLVWAIMTWLVIPWLNPVQYQRADVISAWWFGYHLAYGVGVSLAPALRRRLYERFSQYAGFQRGAPA